MTSLNVIENKISSIRKYLGILEPYKNYSKGEIENNIVVRGAVERYLYLLTQSAIELAQAVVSFKKMRKPATLRESFQILKEENFIDRDLAEKMINMVGFRNIIAHDYEDLDYTIVYDVLQNNLKDIEEFIKAVQTGL